jgi:hypothetical protein
MANGIAPDVNNAIAEDVNRELCACGAFAVQDARVTDGRTAEERCESF